MANKTTKDAGTIHGTNPQYLIEKIIRTRIYESRYWKEDCFALSGKHIVVLFDTFERFNFLSSVS